MGCDIHAGLFQVDSWADFVAIPPVDRYYDFFSVLAGVRGEYEPIVEPRGLPEWFKREPWWSEHIVDGDHTASWLTLQELLDFRDGKRWRGLDENVRGAVASWIELGEFYRKYDFCNSPPDRFVFVFNFDS